MHSVFIIGQVFYFFSWIKIEFNKCLLSKVFSMFSKVTCLLAYYHFYSPLNLKISTLYIVTFLFMFSFLFYVIYFLFVFFSLILLLFSLFFDIIFPKECIYYSFQRFVFFLYQVIQVILYFVFHWCSNLFILLSFGGWVITLLLIFILR